MAPLRAFASVEALPYFPHSQHSYRNHDLPPLPQPRQQPTAFSYPSQDSLPRPSMSPMNGAAFAMKNFLLRRRGTSTSTISTKSDVVNNHSQLTDDPHDSPSSSPMQHFVFVGGYGVVPGTTTVIYDSDIAVSEANTPTAPHFRSSIFMAGPGTRGSIVSMGDYDQALMAATAASLAELELEDTHSFPQAMTTRVGRGRTPSLSNSSRTSRSRHASMMSNIQTTSTAATSTTTLDGASAYKSSGRRSLSLDSLRVGKSNTASKGEKDGGKTDFGVESFMEAYSANTAKAVGPLDIPTDPEERGNDDQYMDIWSSSMDSGLSLSLDAIDLPADAFKLQFSFDDVQYESQQKELHEQQWQQQWQQLQQQQKEEQEEREQGQLRKQQLEKQQQLYQNSVSLLLAGKLINSNKNMTPSNNNNNNGTTGSPGKNSPLKLRHHPSEPVLLNRYKVPSGTTDFQDTEEAVEAVEKEIMVLRSKEIVIPQSNIIEAASPPPSKSVSAGVISGSSSPTQFYDEPQTRHALRTFLTNNGCQFDEMVEYGFPYKQEANKCRYLTLRITLTPWHARADEARLYGTSASMPGKQTQFKAIVNRLFSRSGGASIAPTTTASLPPSQRARPSGAPRAYSDQPVASLRSDQVAYSPRRVDSLRRDMINSRGAASPTPTGSKSDASSRRRARDYSYAKQLQVEEMNGISPIPSQPQTQKQERSSSRSPHQLHAFHQEQIRLQQQTLLRTSPTSAGSLVSPPYPATPSRSTSAAAVAETMEDVYEHHHIVGAEKISELGSQQQREKVRSATPTRQGPDSPPNSKGYNVSMADRPLSMGPPPPMVPPPPPPRVNTKNRRHRDSRAYGAVPLTVSTGTPNPAGSVADAIAATASLAAIAKAAQFGANQYHPPPQLLSTPYEDQEDSNQHDQSAEAYFEMSMDFNNQEREVVGEVDGEDYHYNRRESVEAVQAGGCWRPVQNRQTTAMKTYAFP